MDPAKRCPKCGDALEKTFLPNSRTSRIVCTGCGRFAFAPVLSRREPSPLETVEQLYIAARDKTLSMREPTVATTTRPAHCYQIAVAKTTRTRDGRNIHSLTVDGTEVIGLFLTEDDAIRHGIWFVKTLTRFRDGVDSFSVASATPTPKIPHRKAGAKR